MADRLKRLHVEAKRTRELLVILALAATLLSTVVVTTKAAFTVAPTLDLTTMSNIASASTIYTFHVENPDLLESVSTFSVLIPAGYSIDPAYLTTTPGIVVMTGVFGFIGFPPLGSLKVKTTTTSGLFNVYAYVPGELPVGTATVVPPTLTTPGAINGLLTILVNGIYVDLTISVVNPSTPGVYTWGPNTATPAGGGPTVNMDPRLNFTNQVEIIAPTGEPVGGYVLPADKLPVLAPYILLTGLIGLIGVVSVVYTATRRRRT